MSFIIAYLWIILKIYAKANKDSWFWKVMKIELRDDFIMKMLSWQSGTDCGNSERPASFHWPFITSGPGSALRWQLRWPRRLNTQEDSSKNGGEIWKSVLLFHYDPDTFHLTQMAIVPKFFFFLKWRKYTDNPFHHQHEVQLDMIHGPCQVALYCRLFKLKHWQVFFFFFKPQLKAICATHATMQSVAFCGHAPQYRFWILREDNQHCPIQ